jgi:hypothetical protein
MPVYLSLLAITEGIITYVALLYYPTQVCMDCKDILGFICFFLSRKQCCSGHIHCVKRCLLLIHSAT